MKLSAKIILFVFISIWISGIFIEFLIPTFNWLAYVFPFVKQIYATVCHQQIDKLIQFGGYKTMVCSRCTGIYLGGFISSFVLLFIKRVELKNGKLMLFASFPMLLDVLLYKNGFYQYSKTIAFISGLVFGSVGIVYIYNGLQILLEKNGKL